MYRYTYQLCNQNNSTIKTAFAGNDNYRVDYCKRAWLAMFTFLGRGIGKRGIEGLDPQIFKKGVEPYNIAVLLLQSCSQNTAALGLSTYSFAAKVNRDEILACIQNRYFAHQQNYFPCISNIPISFCFILRINIIDIKLSDLDL